MKKTLTLLLIFLMLPCISAINLKVEKQSSDEVLIKDLDRPVIFELEVMNIGPDDNFRFDNIPGFFVMSPVEISIKQQETKEVQLKIYARENLEYDRFFYTLQYFIKGNDSSIQSEELRVKIIKLKDAFEIGSGEIDPESNSIDIYIHNKENYDFKEIKAKFSSPFFNLEEDFSLGPYEKINFTINLNKEDFKQLVAGSYTLNAEVSIDEKKTNVEGTIEFIEKNIVTTTRQEYGFFISTKIISKENKGNVLVPLDTTIKKNIISRLFTSFNPEPDVVERQMLIVYYTWNKEINPGEISDIRVKTNWFFPLIIIFFIILIVILAKQHSKTNLIMRKKVSFVRASGGEFALKISIILNAKKYIERVSITDKLPPLVKLHERFTGEEPIRIDEKNKRLEWDFEKLEKGEIRMLSYIVYSKLGILGKFTLPRARAVFEKDGKIEESESNIAFFITEQRKGEIEEEEY